MTIGLVGGSSGAALSKELKKLGHSVALVAGKKSDPGILDSDYSLIVDLEEHNKILNFFVSNKVKHIVVGTGHWKAIKLASFLQENNLQVSIDPRKSDFAKNKVLFNKNLSEIGFSIPKQITFNQHYEIQNVINEVGIPCVVKSPIDLTQPRKANSINELEEAIKNVINTGSNVLIEEYLSGIDYTVPVVNDGQRIKSLGALNYNKAGEYNLIGFHNKENDRLSKEMEEMLEKVAINIVEVFNFTGLVRVDFIVKNKKMYILELNSVIMTSEESTLRPFYIREEIDIAKEMIEVSLKICENKENGIL